MSRFNTGNPLDSDRLEDLSDNAKNMDLAANSGVDTFKDRLGRSRLTYAGMESEFQSAQASREARFNDFIASSGYQFVGDYGPGIEITEYNQLIRDSNGEFWRVSGQVDLPYVTTGAGIPEADAFMAVGDAVLRQGLGSNATAQGSDLIAHTGTSDTVTEALGKRVIFVNSLSELKTIETASNGQLVILSGDRHGTFEFIDSDLSSEVSSDPLEGIYIPPSSDSSGSSGAYRRIVTRYITPNMFGASGENFEDQTEEIQYCLDFSVSLGVTALIKEGHYGVSDTLFAPENLRLVLERSAHLKRIGTNGGILNNYLPNSDISARSASSNIKIKGGIWDGQGSILGSNSIINIAQARNIHLSNMEVIDCAGGHHLELSGVSEVTVRDSTFRLYTDPGGREFSEAIQIDFMGGEDQLPGLDPASYDGANCENVLMENLIFEDVARAIGSHSWDGGPAHWAESITIRNIITRRCSHDVIRPQGWRNFNIENVFSDTTGSGSMFIRVEDCENFTIRNVECSQSGNRGIWVRKNINPEMKNWVLEDVRINNSSSPSAAAIEIFNVGRGTVRNCTVGNSSNWGINVSSSTDVTVDNCSVLQASNMQIRLYDNINSLVSNCTLESSGGDRVIDIQEGGSQRAVENTISGVVAGKIGISVTNQAFRALVRGNRISGTGGKGIDVSSSSSEVWLDSNDIRSIGSGIAIDDSSSDTILTNNQT